MRKLIAAIVMVFTLGALPAAPVRYSVSKSEGVGEQLRAEILAVNGIPQDGWTVEQDLKTGVIVVTYMANVDLTQAQKTAIAGVLSGHTPAFDSIGDDPPELLLGKLAYAQRHWSSLTTAQKDRLLRALTVLAIRGWGRWS